MAQYVNTIEYSENGYNDTVNIAHNIALKQTSELVFIIKPFFNDMEKETIEYDTILKNHHIKALFLDNINSLIFSSKPIAPIVLILDIKNLETIKKAIQIITDYITDKDNTSILLIENIDAIYSTEEQKTLILSLEHNKITSIIGI